MQQITSPLFGVLNLSWVFQGLAVVVFLWWILSLLFDEHFGKALGPLLALLAIFHVGGVYDLLTPLRHPLETLVVLVGYFLIGLLWSVLKWNFYVAQWGRETRKKVADAQRTWSDKFTEEDKTANPEGWKRHLRGWDLPAKSPRVASSVSRLVGWAFWWPLSMAWTILDDPLRRLYEYVIIVVLGRGLQRVADKQKAGLEEFVE